LRISSITQRHSGVFGRPRVRRTCEDVLGGYSGQCSLTPGARRTRVHPISHSGCSPTVRTSASRGSNATVAAAGSYLEQRTSYSPSPPESGRAAHHQVQALPSRSLATQPIKIRSIPSSYKLHSKTRSRLTSRRAPAGRGVVRMIVAQRAAEIASRMTAWLRYPSMLCALSVWLLIAASSTIPTGNRDARDLPSETGSPRS